MRRGNPRRGVSRAEVVSGVLILSLLGVLMIPAVRKARETARRQESANRLRRVGGGLHAYHTVRRTLPAGGTFAADGTPQHSWTLHIHPFMESSPFYYQIDFAVPWDAPWNRLFFQNAKPDDTCGLTDPGLALQRTATGHPAIHFAPNQRLLHRNSRVRLEDVPDWSQTLLMGEAFDDFAGFGDPVDWRDATLPFRTSTAGFGHVDRPDGTHVLFADTRVAVVSDSIDPRVSASLAGTGVAEPERRLTALRSSPYVSPADSPWTHFWIYRGGHKDLARFALSPDRTGLVVILETERIRSQDIGAWRGRFERLVGGAAVESVEIRGTIDAAELAPFVELSSLRLLDLRQVRIVGDPRDMLRNKPQLKVLQSGDG